MTNTPCHSLVKTVLKKTYCMTEVMEYGTLKEKGAESIFEQVQNVVVVDSGLWVDVQHGFLGASPDGLVGDDALFEIKCLHSSSKLNLQRNTISEIIDLMKNKICLEKHNNKIQLKRNHNYYYQITGIVIISVGKTLKAYFHEFDKLMDNKYFHISNLLIVIDVVIFIIAFFGCCEAIKENASMTTTYSTLLVIIFVLELTVGIVAAVLKSGVEQFLYSRLHETMEQYGNSSFNETTAMWDAIQIQFQCCGVDNYTDWSSIMYDEDKDLPLSCCKIATGSISFTCNSNNAYKDGCLEEFGNFVSYNISYVEGVGFGIALIQLLGIIFSCCLSKFIRSDYETV